jgi:hypothetical protein
MTCHTMQLILQLPPLALTSALAVIDPTGPIPLTAEQTFDAVARGAQSGYYGVGGHPRRRADPGEVTFRAGRPRSIRLS